MGKRSNFERVERDFYSTPIEAVIPLFPHLGQSCKYYEPCVGDGRLLENLSGGFNGHVCVGHSDIHPLIPSVTKNALDITIDDLKDADYIITNPPWDRKILHPMIHHFRRLCKTWLLFDADWPHTKQSVDYMKYCSKIVAIGRVKWIDNSVGAGKDNAAWYEFLDKECETVFYGR